jgi:hypothetical protein
MADYSFLAIEPSDPKMRSFFKMKSHLKGVLHG